MNMWLVEDSLVCIVSLCLSYRGVPLSPYALRHLFTRALHTLLRWTEGSQLVNIRCLEN